MMKEKQKSKAKKIIISLSIFCVLYFILALKPLSTELHMSPEWTEDISRIHSASETDVLIPYRLGRNIGYFTPEGKITSNIIFPFQATIDDNYYAVYLSNNTKTELYTKDNQYVTSIKEPGFPYFDNGRLYLFYAGGASFARFDIEGNKLWSFEGYAPITAFASSESATAIGLADGTIISIDNNGNVDQTFAPGGSDVEIIMGIAISEDGQLIAAVSGQDKQRFTVAQKNGEHSKIIFHEYLDADFKEQVLVKFSKDTNTVYYNYKGGLGIVDLTKMKSSHIAIDGIISQIEESDNPKLVFVLSHKDIDYMVTAIEPFDNKAGAFDFEADNAFIQVYGDGLFIGRNNKISRLTITRK